MQISALIDEWKPLIERLLKILVFDAKIQPSEFENMPLSRLLVYAKLYGEYVKEVNPETKE